jgi:hypothetical protein
MARSMVVSSQKKNAPSITQPTTFAQELAQAMLAYPKIPSKLPIMVSRIGISQTSLRFRYLPFLSPSSTSRRMASERLAEFSAAHF